jgi:DNA-binding transcriptional LysR family regulator
MEVTSANQLGLELRHLIALEAVARHLSFHRAAEELGYTPSAVSQQVVALERAVGARVFERSRGPRPIRLTEPGRVLLGHARAVLTRMQAVAADVGALTEGALGELRIGTYQSLATRLLPPLLAEFRRAWPRIEIALRETGSHDELDEMVERGVLDVAFTIMPASEADVLERTDLLSDPYVLVVPAEHELAGERRVRSLGQLGEIDLVAYRVCRANAQVERFLRSSGVEPRVVLRAEDNALLQHLVAAGLGAAIMPLLAVDPPRPDVALLDASELLPRRRIGLVHHRDRYRSPAHEAFVELARDHAARLAERLTIDSSGELAFGPPSPG